MSLYTQKQGQYLAFIYNYTKVNRRAPAETDIQHFFNVTPPRELYKKYNYSPHDMNVAYAIVTDILKRDEIPAELLEAISSLLAFYQSLKEEGDLKEPG